MFSSLSDFDPLTFLDLDGSKYQNEDAEYIKSVLINEMGKYVLLKLAEKIPSDQFEDLISENDGVTILSKLKDYLPNSEEEIKKGLEEFKSEYKKGEN